MGMIIVLPMLFLFVCIAIWYIGTALFGEALGNKLLKINNKFIKNLLEEDENEENESVIM